MSTLPLDAVVSGSWISNVPFGAANGMPLLLDALYPAPVPPSLLPVIIWVHGNGFVAGQRCDDIGICHLFAQHGFFAVTIDYRLSHQAAFPTQIHDVKAAIRWVRANAATYALDSERIGIAGFSAGGHLAALAALTSDMPDLEGSSGSSGFSSRVHAVAVGAAPSDFLDHRHGERRDFLSDFLGGTPEERADLWRRASPIYHVHRDAPPFLIAHGMLDEVVPFAQAERLATMLQAVGVEVEFIPIEGDDHNWEPLLETAEWRRGADLEHLALQFFHKRLLPRN